MAIGGHPKITGATNQSRPSRPSGGPQRKHLSAVPFRAWQALSVLKHRKPEGSGWPVLEKAESTLRHGPGCQRAESRRSFVALVTVSEVLV